MDFDFSPSALVHVAYAVVASSCLLMLMFYTWVLIDSLVDTNTKIAFAQKKVAQLRALQGNDQQRKIF